ncbi:hypothetical protein SSS_02331, partial [Sarcoptes scabiei]
ESFNFIIFIHQNIEFHKADEFKDEFYGELDQNFDEIKHKFYADLSDGGDSMKDSRKKDKKVINSIYQNNDCFRKILDLHRRIGKSIIFRFKKYTVNEKNFESNFKIIFNVFRYQIDEFEDYLNQLDEILKEILTTNQTQIKSATEFCSNLHRIEAIIASFVKNSEISSLSNKNFWRTLIEKTIILRFNVEKIIQWLPITIFFISQFLLLLFYFKVGLTKCLILVLMNLIVFGSLFHYYLKCKMNDPEFNPTPLEFILHFFVEIFCNLHTKFFKTIGTNLNIDNYGFFSSFSIKILISIVIVLIFPTFFTFLRDLLHLFCFFDSGSIQNQQNNSEIIPSTRTTHINNYYFFQNQMKSIGSDRYSLHGTQSRQRNFEYIEENEEEENYFSASEEY